MNRFMWLVVLSASIAIFNAVFQLGIVWWVFVIIPLVPVLIILGSVLAVIAGAVIMVIGMCILFIMEALVSTK